jgi:hypothetical protein
VAQVRLQLVLLLTRRSAAQWQNGINPHYARYSFIYFCALIMLAANIAGNSDV